MKKIECIIRQERLKDLTQALCKLGVGGMTVSEVRGFGSDSHRPYNLLFVHKTKIEIYTSDAQVKDIISTVLMYCSCGKSGDGKMAVIPLDNCIRISNGDSQERAITKGKGEEE